MAEKGQVEDKDTTSKSKAKKGHTESFYDSWVDSLEQALPTASASEDDKNVLSSLTLSGVADFLKTGKARNVVVMTGAGVSTAAGIPDFRSPGTGLYDNLEQYDLPHPMAIFEIGYFRKNPEPFFTLAKSLFPKQLKPTICHYFIRLLEEKGHLRRIYTQNIDSLEHVAGISESKVVAAHGSHHTNTCMKCHKVFSLQWMSEKLNDEEVKIPRCDVCENVVKPDIVFFGEALPRKFFTHALMDFPKCDLLLIMGTSLTVQPFASMVAEVGRTVPRLLVNMTKVGHGNLCYDDEHNYRDVFFEGTCDEGAEKLASYLGWTEELNNLVKREWAKIDTDARTNDSIEKNATSPKL